MKSQTNIIRYTFLGLIFILLLIIFSNYSYLENFVNNFFETQIYTWGYLAIFVFIFFLELIPQPLISGLIPLTIGLSFDLSYKTLIVITLISAILANYLAYYLGYFYSDSIALFLVSKENYKKSLVWFSKYGTKIITFLALTPFPYFPVLGGIFKMNFLKFTIYAIIPRIIHFIIFSYIIFIII
jgi:membrane protein YqaA with SNARE-associated domain